MTGHNQGWPICSLSVQASDSKHRKFLNGSIMAGNRLDILFVLDEANAMFGFSQIESNSKIGTDNESSAKPILQTWV